MEKTYTIRLTADTTEDFCNAASRCDFDVNISNAHNTVTVIDAKSLIGVMGLDLNKDLVVSFDGEDETFEAYLEGLKVTEA